MGRIPYRFRPPLSAPEDFGRGPAAYSRTVADGLLIERDVAVRMRDGVIIYVDVFRPADGRAAAPLIGWGPYGKHGPTRMATHFPTADVTERTVSRHAVFEAPAPAFWVPRGYAVINADPRGTWYSEGRATYLSPEEADDFYDLIEWAGTQAWSTGRVGLAGVSYLAFSQWRVAALHPPHLCAINPWEGWTDLYREIVRHGGIPETHFWPYLPGRWGRSSTEIEDLAAETAEHPFIDDFWRSKNPPLEAVTVPAYVVASWTDQGVHTRGTLEGFRRIASTEKWLEVHGRKKWAYFYEPASMARQAAFFDRFLLGKATEIARWPKVVYELRDAYGAGERVAAVDWPIPGTRYRPLFLEGRTGRLEDALPVEEHRCAYDPSPELASTSRSRARRSWPATWSCACGSLPTMPMTPTSSSRCRSWTRRVRSCRLHIRASSRWARPRWDGCALRAASSMQPSRRPSIRCRHTPATCR
jgi:predicted acyl esterase